MPKSIYIAVYAAKRRFTSGLPIALLAAGLLSACGPLAMQQETVIRSLEEQQDLLRSVLEIQHLQAQTLAHQIGSKDPAVQAHNEEMKQTTAALLESLAAFYQSVWGEEGDPPLFTIPENLSESAGSANAENEIARIEPEIISPDEQDAQIDELAARTVPGEKKAPGDKLAARIPEEKSEEKAEEKLEEKSDGQAALDAARALTAKARAAGSSRQVREEWWVLAEGQPFHDQIFRWAGEAEWKVVWKSEYEYPVEASAVFTGPFPEAVRQAVHALKDVYPPIHVTFYQNRVAVVENLDGNY